MTGEIVRTRGSRLAWSIGLGLIVVTGFIVACNAAQILPSARTFGEAWQNAGYPGQIPSPARIINVRDFGALGNGSANDYPAIAAAIASLSNSHGAVYFPAGTYLSQSTLNVPAGVVLRGERSHNTTLLFETLGNCISIARSQSGIFQPVVSGYTIHSHTILVTDGSAFVPGDYAEIREDNDPAWGASDWANKVVGQILRITDVSGNTLTLERPLRITYQSGQNPEIRKITPVSEAGIENLRVDRLLTGTTAQRDNIYTIHLEYAARCWVRGVESTNTFGGHVALVYGTQIDVTGCYLHHAWDYDGGGSGYGARLEFKTGECRIENNIFNHLRHSILLQAGVNGNVFGYNYSREPTRTEFPSEVSGDVVCHGNYPFANLFEGNICQHITIDSSHGANGPLNTFFRNRAETYGFNMTDTLANNQNIVGNETFQGTYAFFVGDGYSLRGTGHFEHGNNTVADGIQPAGTTNLTDISYYLNDNPSLPPPNPEFWNIADTIPTVGLPRDLNSVKSIPARVRYFSGGNFTVGPPSLARQPTDQTVNVGQVATFTVQATGTPIARYAWFKDGIELAGRTNATLNIAGAQLSHVGIYDVLVWDDHGSVLSAPASLVVNGAALSTVTIAATDANASEPGVNSGTFTVSRNGPTNVALTVNYALGGTATPGIDYTNLTGSVTILKGKFSANVVIKPINDVTLECPETAIATIAGSTNYHVGTLSNAVLTIADNELPTVTITAIDPGRLEPGINKGQFCVTRTGCTNLSLLVTFGITGTATGGIDYSNLVGKVTIPKGKLIGTIAVRPIDDLATESSETITLTISNRPTYLISAPGNATVTIQDND